MPLWTSSLGLLDHTFQFALDLFDPSFHHGQEDSV